MTKQEKKAFCTHFFRPTHSVSIPLSYSNSMAEYAKGMLRVCLRYAYTM